MVQAWCKTKRIVLACLCVFGTILNDILFGIYDFHCLACSSDSIDHFFVCFLYVFFFLGQHCNVLWLW